jgi:hypothetical protein
MMPVSPQSRMMTMNTNEEFLRALFHDIAVEHATTLHSFVGDPVSPPSLGAWKALPWRPEWRMPARAINPSANNYVCVSSFAPDKTGDYARRKIMFAALHAVMIDDLGTKLPMSDLKLPPSALVETSPGNYQAWLFLASAVRTIEAAEKLIDEMIRVGISAQMDPGMGGVTRVARLPVGANGKAKYRDRDGNPWRQNMPEFEPERRYTAREIAKAYGLDLTVTQRAARPAPRAGVDPERVAVVKWLRLLGLLGKELRDGYHEMICPWVDEHSDGGRTGTYFMEPGEGNSWMGGFNCHHGHCMDRDINDLIGFVRARKTGLANGSEKDSSSTAAAGDGAKRAGRKGSSKGAARSGTSSSIATRRSAPAFTKPKV